MRRTFVVLLLGLTLIVGGQAQSNVTVTFAWETDPGWPNAAGAQISRNGVVVTCPSLSQFSVTEYRCTMLQPAGTYAFSVRGVTAEGQPGEWAPEVSLTIPGEVVGSGTAVVRQVFRLASTPIPGPAVYTLVQPSIVGNLPGGTGSLTYTTPTANNTLMVACFGLAGTAAPSLTSVVTAGLTWTRARALATSGNFAAELWYTFDATGGNLHTVSWTATGTLEVQSMLAGFGGFVNGVTLGPVNSINNAIALTQHHGEISAPASVVVSCWRSATGFYSMVSRGDNMVPFSNGTRSLYAYRILTAPATLDADILFLESEQGPGVIGAFYTPIAP